MERVGGAAAKAGVRQGDVILAVNRTPIKSVEELRELVGKADKSVALLIQRDDAQIFVPVTYWLRLFRSCEHGPYGARFF